MEWVPLVHLVTIKVDQIQYLTISSLFYSVEKFHQGTADNSVLYIPAAPSCDANLAYLERARKRFEEKLCPPEFHRAPTHESDFKDRATEEDFSEEAKEMFFNPKM